MARNTFTVITCDKCKETIENAGDVYAGVMWDNQGVQIPVTATNPATPGEYCVLCFIEKLETTVKSLRKKHRLEEEQSENPQVSDPVE